MGELIVDGEYCAKACWVEVELIIIRVVVFAFLNVSID